MLGFRAIPSFQRAIAPKSVIRRHVAVKVVEDGRAKNVGEFCSIDEVTGKPVDKTLGEKEADFIEVCTLLAFYGLVL